MIRHSLMAAVLLLVFSGSASARDEPPTPFEYVGGTEDVTEGCEGTLEINVEAMTFRCRGSAIDVPYPAIRQMQFRSNVSRRVLRMKVKWKVRPAVSDPIIKAKRNRYFAVVYESEGSPRVIILRVHSRVMRPYLAELDLRSEKRVEVERFEDD